MRFERVLTITVLMLAIAAIGSLIYVNYFEAQNAYDGSLSVSISKETPGYDYSCDEPEYGLYVVVSNNGAKTVSDLSVAISNPLCKGAVPPFSGQLFPAQQLKFYAYSTAANGTLTISGNNTLVSASF